MDQQPSDPFSSNGVPDHAMNSGNGGQAVWSTQEIQTKTEDASADDEKPKFGFVRRNSMDHLKEMGKNDDSDGENQENNNQPPPFASQQGFPPADSTAPHDDEQFNIRYSGQWAGVDLDDSDSDSDDEFEGYYNDLYGNNALNDGTNGHNVQEPAAHAAAAVDPAFDPGDSMSSIPYPGDEHPSVGQTITRLCGPSRTRCGYCGGKRLHILEVEDGWNKVVPTASRDVKENEKNNVGDSDPMDEQKIDQSRNHNVDIDAVAEERLNGGGESNRAQSQELDIVDENNTSKSYGLLFDLLPFDTYLEFINRGWRRSGKHLYRPHNAESCCPAISIRLDVTKFAPRPQDNSSKKKNTDLAKMVLTGGSKSQRRVGKNILRSLEAHNAKCDVAEGTTVSPPSNPSFQIPKRSSFLSLDGSIQSHSSTYATHVVAQMNLDDNEMDLSPKLETKKGAVEKRSVFVANIHDIEDTNLVDRAELQTEMGGKLGRSHSESTNKNKKPRRLSPVSRKENPSDSNVGTDKSNGKISKSKKQGSVIRMDKNELKQIEEHEQGLLDKLNRVVYQTITRESMEALKSSATASGGDGTHSNPKWAWWETSNLDGGDSLPKWCLLKLVVPTKPENKNIISLMASTPACAAASGRSRGLVDKSKTARAVVDALKSFAFGGSLQRDKEENTSMLRVSDISFHEKSGHVHVVFELLRDDCGKLSSLSKSNDLEEKLNGSSFEPNPATMSQITGECDPVDEFLEYDHTHTVPFIPSSLRKQRSSGMHSGSRNSASLTPSQRVKKNQQLFLTVRSVPVYESSLQPEVHQLFCRYQSLVHGDLNPFDSILDSMGNEKNEMACGDEEEDTSEYADYVLRNVPGFINVDAAYSHLNSVHRSKIKKSYLSFYRFLCETPLEHVTRPANTEGKKHGPYAWNDAGYDVFIPFGTYHQQYRLSSSKDAFDGPLVAVGVVDILPSCLSSVYAFYDPNLSLKWELGKYTALREIEWVRHAMQQRKDLHYYYLGYYIHSCQKMIYKAEYKPSELLCPVNLKWVDFEVAKIKLEEGSPVRHCCALHDASSADSATKTNFTVDDISLDIGGGEPNEPNIVQVKMLNSHGRELIDPIVNDFVKEVGLDMCHHFIIKLS